MFFSVMSKNLNWKISTKNLVTLKEFTFKRWDRVNDKKFLILWEFTEKSDFFFWTEGGAGCMKKLFFWRGESPKKEGFDSLQIYKGLSKTRGCVYSQKEI